MDKCGHSRDGAVCVLPRGHAGLHSVYETQNETGTLTAAELREIGERMNAKIDPETMEQMCFAGTKVIYFCQKSCEDKARLYEAVVGLIDFSISEANGRWCIGGMPGDLIWFETKDAAIDALLAQGGA